VDAELVVHVIVALVYAGVAVMPLITGAVGTAVAVNAGTVALLLVTVTVALVGEKLNPTLLGVTV
jgi:hypothetical protein